MNHIGLFEGIGGFSLAARWMNWSTIAWCEWNPFCQKVLSHHFPKAKQHGDITTTDFSVYRGQCDVLTGGFPCQPFSLAGEQKGSEDERFLWPEMFRAVDEIRPPWVVGENVPGIADDEFTMRAIKDNLESLSYNLLPVQIPASLVGANHQRKRIWFIAYSDSYGMERCREAGNIAENRQRREGSQATLFNQREFARGYSAESESELIRADDGIPNWMDRVAACGNAIAPKVAYEIFKTIEQYEQLTINHQ